jgi:anion-transporting  ArsA/GET3 family ATPase
MADNACGEMLLDDLLARRLVILSGKGGVGKSVVGMALALAARERGKRVLLVEIDTPLEAARFLGAPPAGPKETELLPGLFTVNLEPQAVIDEYVRHAVRVEMLVRRILASPIYRHFYSWAPGLKDLVVLGKIVVLAEAKEGWSRKPRYDLVIMDAPATGHGLSLLKAPVAASAAIPVGPIGYQARWILQHLRDPRYTALTIVAIPEEMAVVEALEFYRVARDDLGIPPLAVFLNACHERRLSEDQEAEVLRLTSAGADGRLAQGVTLAMALAAARHHIRRRKLTRFYQARLKRALPVPVIGLPYVFEEELSQASLRVLAGRLQGA